MKDGFLVFPRYFSNATCCYIVENQLFFYNPRGRVLYLDNRVFYNIMMSPYYIFRIVPYGDIVEIYVARSLNPLSFILLHRELNYTDIYFGIYGIFIKMDSHETVYITPSGEIMECSVEGIHDPSYIGYDHAMNNNAQEILHDDKNESRFAFWGVELGRYRIKVDLGYLIVMDGERSIFHTRDILERFYHVYKVGSRIIVEYRNKRNEYVYVLVENGMARELPFKNRQIVPCFVFKGGVEK